MEILTPKLSVKNLHKSFDGRPVLQDLSFDLMEGEFLSVLGPSGCGKTTLVRILMGLDSADRGSILKGGQEISHLPSAQRGMGIVFQNYALFPNMTVLENVLAAMHLRKKSNFFTATFNLDRAERKQFKEKAEALLREVG